MSFPTLHPENKAINLLDSALTLFPDLKPELRQWVQKVQGTIAKPVDVPGELEHLRESSGSTDIDMPRETFLLAVALCEYRQRVYPDGKAAPFDPNGDARDDLESSISRFEERLSRAHPEVELDHSPDAGDYYGSEDTGGKR